MTRSPYEESVPHSKASPELALGAYLPTIERPRAIPAPAPVAPTGSQPLEAALERLEEVIDEENAALNNGGRPDFASFNRRKSQNLLELTRLSRALPHGAPSALRDGIGRVRTKLVANQRTLGLHLSAVREIADLMVGALADAESDGTYAKARARREIPR